jgi:hypothetical protein
MANVDYDKILTQDAVLAVRAYLGCDELTATEVVDVVKPHLNRALRLELARAQETIESTQSK